MARQRDHGVVRFALWASTIAILAAGCQPDNKIGFSPPPTPPLIAFNDSTVDFISVSGGADPAPQSVNTTNFGGGNLDALKIGNVSYPAGQSAGWLSAGVAGSPPIVTLQPATAGLLAGDYTATVTLSHPTASNSPQSLSVSLQVTDQPVMALSATQVRFAAVPAAPIPVTQTVDVTNAGPGSLSGLTVGPISYAQGQPVGWLTASIGGAVAPATITLRPNTVTLAPGTYVASVPVNSPVATNAPVSLAVAYTITAAPVIAGSPATFALAATAGASSPASVTSSITNAGGGTLTGLTVEPIAFGFGASNWLTATLNSASAPATLTIVPNITGIPAGNYNASIPLSSTDPTVDTVPVRVTLNLVAPPQIAFSVSAVNYSGIAGGTDPVSQSVLVTNGGTGTLAGLSLGAVSYGAGATGWLSTSLSGTAAPATITLTPNSSGIPAGSFTAAVSVNSGSPGVASKNLQVTLTLASAAPGGLVILGGNNQTSFTGNLLPTPLTVRVLTAANLPIPGAPVTWTVNNGGSLSVSSSVANASGDATTRWTVGPTVGTHTVTAQTPGVPSAVFSANVQARVSTGYPNEPAGFTKITERSFDQKIEDGWTDRGDALFQIVTDPAPPRSAPNVGQARFNLGRAGGTGPILLARRLDQTAYNSIYISFWIKFSGNWDGHTSHVNKLYHIWIAGINRVYLSAQGFDLGPLQPQVRLQRIAGPQIVRNLGPNLRSVNIQRNNWHRWELILRTNSAGNSDGTADWWIDGIHVGSYSDIPYVAANEPHNWEVIYWNPTWGGAGDIVPADQYQYMDHIYISGK